jgi:hypothetical protein
MNMNRPRFSIAWVLGLIVLLGLDFGFFRWATDSPGWLDGRASLAIVIAMPVMLNVLFWPAILIVRDLIRRDECGPFVAGFLVFGTLALVVVTTLVAIFYRAILLPVINLLEPFLDAIRTSTSPEIRPVCAVILISLVLAAPQLVLAFLGGVLNQQFGGIRIVTRRRLEQVRWVESASADEPAASRDQRD